MAAPPKKPPKKDAKARPVPRVEMRRRREQLGYTREKAAAAIGVSVSSWKGWENGTQNPLPGHRPPIARVLMVPTPEVQAWFDPRPERLTVIDISDWLGHFASLERSATYIRTFHLSAVPALLQTSAYAAAVASVQPGTVSETDVARAVEVRLARQAVLAEPDPPTLHAIIDEAVFVHRVGGPDVMAEQLDHLLLAAERPNVEVRILPGTSGYCCTDSFTLLGASASAEPFMACVEEHLGVDYRERRRGLPEYIELYSFIADLALSPPASIELIQRVAKELHR